MKNSRIVVVTGASQNIGEAIAQRFYDDGATVVCADLGAPQHDRFDFVKTDVSSEESVAQLMSHVKNQYGQLDVLVNNAGICVEQLIHETSSAQWDKVMGINIKGVFLTTKHAFELLKQAEHASIVNISSIEGLAANPLHGVYAASKAAVAAFSHNTALEYGASGIRCNAVAPGWINTPFNEALLNKYPDRVAVDSEIQALHPVGRLGTPEDIANTVYWLASQDSAFVSGQEIVVDGGRLAKLPLPKL